MGDTMCDCLSRIPSDLKGSVAAALARFRDRPIYLVCALIEPNFTRPAFHRVLRWADSLAACPQCGPRLNGRDVLLP